MTLARVGDRQSYVSQWQSLQGVLRGFDQRLDLVPSGQTPGRDQLGNALDLDPSPTTTNTPNRERILGVALKELWRHRASGRDTGTSWTTDSRFDDSARTLLP